MPLITCPCIRLVFGLGPMILMTGICGGIHTNTIPKLFGTMLHPPHAHPLLCATHTLMTIRYHNILMFNIRIIYNIQPHNQATKPQGWTLQQDAQTNSIKGIYNHQESNPTYVESSTNTLNIITLIYHPTSRINFLNLTTDPLISYHSTLIPIRDHLQHEAITPCPIVTLLNFPAPGSHRNSWLWSNCQSVPYSCHTLRIGVVCLTLSIETPHKPYYMCNENTTPAIRILEEGKGENKGRRKHFANCKVVPSLRPWKGHRHLFRSLAFECTTYGGVLE